MISKFNKNKKHKLMFSFGAGVLLLAPTFLFVNFNNKQPQAQLLSKSVSLKTEGSVSTASPANFKVPVFHPHYFDTSAGTSGVLSVSANPSPTNPSVFVTTNNYVWSVDKKGYAQLIKMETGQHYGNWTGAITTPNRGYFSFNTFDGQWLSYYDGVGLWDTNFGWGTGGRGAYFNQVRYSKPMGQTLVSTIWGVYDFKSNPMVYNNTPLLPHGTRMTWDDGTNTWAGSFGDMWVAHGKSTKFTVVPRWVWPLAGDYGPTAMGQNANYYFAAGNNTVYLKSKTHKWPYAPNFEVMKNFPVGGGITSIFTDTEGNVWFYAGGTVDGTHILVLPPNETTAVKTFIPVTQLKGVTVPPHSIIEDPWHRIWIADSTPVGPNRNLSAVFIGQL